MTEPIVETRNLFGRLPAELPREELTPLLETPGFRLVRIVSTGHATPDGEWYDQEESEWVVVLRGRAGLRFEGEDEIRVLSAGDYLHIPAHARHRVAWTDETQPTVWLALHYQDPSVAEEP